MQISENNLYVHRQWEAHNTYTQNNMGALSEGLLVACLGVAFAIQFSIFLFMKHKPSFILSLVIHDL